MDYDQAIEVLRSWDGLPVMIVAFVEPGVSLRPFEGVLGVEDGERGVVRAVVDPGEGTPLRVAVPRATFHEASWVPGHDERGLSVVQGATRVDVWLEA